MIFNTFVYYFVFLLPAAILFRILPVSMRSWSCAGFGIAFFIYFSWTQFGGWIGAACIGLLVWEASFRAFYREGSKACLVGVFISILTLGVFKYWNFFTDGLFIAYCSNPVRWEQAFLPLGISFFTFEFIHYAVERYRGNVERGRLDEYLAFIFFFPTMVAGPIKRFQDFLPSVREPSTDWTTDWNRGITRILTGLAKKFVIADMLTSLTDHLNANDILVAQRWVLPLWLIAYGWKIYFDFSAYSDIAIGSGRLFGIKIPENFDWPYSRTNIAEFWRHWHMSLYNWLVDYVFIPLGGSRHSNWRVSINIMIVMLVSGIWHGAGLNFVCWGAWHGLLLITHRLWSRATVNYQWKSSTVYAFGSWGLTYAAVNIGWVLFAMDLQTAGIFFKRLLVG